MNPAPPPPDTSLPVEPPRALADYLEQLGFRAVLTVQRKDGAPLTEDDRTAIPILLDAFGVEADQGRTDNELFEVYAAAQARKAG